MDLQMPEMDGYEAAEKIRAMSNDPYFKSVPIMALTASAMIDIKDKVLAYGMNDFISKPFQPEELQSKIARYVLNEKQQHEQPKKSSNLDLYSEGDYEFKRELATLLIKNIEELVHSLEESIQQKDPGSYGRTVHKVKTTLTMLGDHEFTDRVNDILNKLDNNHRSDAMAKEVKTFKELCLRIIEGLKEEMKTF
jgi:response regulator RpfG family c-di-GMP phosphodiesterase